MTTAAQSCVLVIARTIPVFVESYLARFLTGTEIAWLRVSRFQYTWKNKLLAPREIVLMISPEKPLSSISTRQTESSEPQRENENG